MELELKTSSNAVSAAKPGQSMSAGKLVFLVGIPLLLAVWYISGAIYWFNRDVKEIAIAYAGAIQIEKECKRRDDLIPSLISITKQYAKHERELFQYVSDARSELGPASEMRNAPAALKNQELLTKIIALSEQYPDLKASQSFIDLMSMIETTEDRIAQMRDNYIRAVLDYNICNQCVWCPFFTFFINFVSPMPNFIDYYYLKSSFTGEWQKLGAPGMLQEELTEKEKNELLRPTPFRLGVSEENSMTIQPSSLPQEATK
jgi:LemA protein